MDANVQESIVDKIWRHHSPPSRQASELEIGAHRGVLGESL